MRPTPGLHRTRSSVRRPDLIHSGPAAACRRAPLEPSVRRRSTIALLARLTVSQERQGPQRPRVRLRLRVGNYRVFFDFDGAVRIVSIEEVRKRDERTY